MPLSETRSRTRSVGCSQARKIVGEGVRTELAPSPFLQMGDSERRRPLLLVLLVEPIALHLEDSQDVARVMARSDISPPIRNQTSLCSNVSSGEANRIVTGPASVERVSRRPRAISLSIHGSLVNEKMSALNIVPRCTTLKLACRARASRIMSAST